MADQQDGAVVFAENLLEQFECFDVEIIGGLIKHQQVVPAREQPCQEQTVAFPSRQRTDRSGRLAGIEQEIAQVGHHVQRAAGDLDRVPSARAQGGADRPVRVQALAFLVEVDRDDPEAGPDVAAVGPVLADQQAKQRGLADPVPAQGRRSAHPASPWS